MHSPYYRNRPDSKLAFLFVHGILSSPRHFDWLVSKIPDVFEVKSLLLAGHGGSVTDFSRATMQIWKLQVETALTDLEKPDRRIIIVGHSLGALLALQAIQTHNSMQGFYSSIHRCSHG